MGVSAALVFAMACRTSGTAQAPTASTQEPSAASGPPGAAGDPLMRPGPDIKGHASDQVVSGDVTAVSASSVSIETDTGTRVLEIAPETSITVDGEEATFAELAEGEPVRASYSEVEGRDVAVAIEVERAPSLDEPLGADVPSLPEPASPNDPLDPPPGGASGGTGTGSSGEGPGSPARPHW
jgi:hypothetical protein